MDKRLQDAMSFANHHATLNAHQKILQARADRLKIVYYGRGKFLANLTTMQNIMTYMELFNASSGVIEDSNNNPILIDSFGNLLDELKGAYHESINEYFNGLHALSELRDLKKLIEE